MVILANIDSFGLVTRWNHALGCSLLCQKHYFFLEFNFSTQETTTFCLNWKYQTRVSHFKHVVKVWVKGKTNNPSAFLPSSGSWFKYPFQAAKKKGLTLLETWLASSTVRSQAWPILPPHFPQNEGSYSTKKWISLNPDSEKHSSWPQPHSHSG